MRLIVSWVERAELTQFKAMVMMKFSTVCVFWCFYFVVKPTQPREHNQHIHNTQNQQPRNYLCADNVSWTECKILENLWYTFAVTTAKASSVFTATALNCFLFLTTWGIISFLSSLISTFQQNKYYSVHHCCRHRLSCASASLVQLRLACSN